MYIWTSACFSLLMSCSMTNGRQSEPIRLEWVPSTTSLHYVGMVRDCHFALCASPALKKWRLANTVFLSSIHTTPRLFQVSFVWLLRLGTLSATHVLRAVHISLTIGKFLSDVSTSNFCMSVSLIIFADLLASHPGSLARKLIQSSAADASKRSENGGLTFKCSLSTLSTAAEWNNVTDQHGKPGRIRLSKFLNVSVHSRLHNRFVCGLFAGWIKKVCSEQLDTVSSKEESTSSSYVRCFAAAHRLCTCIKFHCTIH